MTIQTITNKEDGTLVFDDETGELHVHLPNTKPKKKVTNFDKYIGIDTKYPYDCVTKESLIEVLSVMDGYVNDDRISIASDMLLEATIQNLLTPQQLKLIKHVITNCTGWNIYIGNIKDLCSCGIPEKNLSRVLNELSPHVFKIREKNKPFRGDIVIEFNPFYGWKGDNELRSMRLNSWYALGAENQ